MFVPRLLWVGGLSSIDLRYPNPVVLSRAFSLGPLGLE